MEYILEKTKTGRPTLCARTEKESFYLHSRYDPLKEAKKFLQSRPLEKYDFIIILGLGLGYVLEELLLCYPDRRIFVVENDARIFAIFKEMNPDLVRRKDITFFINRPPLAVSLDIIKEFDLARYKGFMVLEMPSLMRLHEAYYDSVKKKIKEQFDHHVGTQMTKIKMLTSVFYNFLKNIDRPFMVLQFDKEKTRKATALIISAGPSLEHDIPAIKALQKKMVLFCVDTAFKYLIYNRIIPDFVFSVDPQFISHLHFTGIQVPQKTHVVLDLFSSFFLHRILDNSVIISTNMISQVLFHDFEYLMDSRCGSVTNYAIQFIHKAGFKNTILTGFDLGYPDKKMYIPYSYITEHFLKRIDRWKSEHNLQFDFYANRARARMDINGKEVPTSHAMLDYKKWLEENKDNLNNISVSKNSAFRLKGLKTVDLEKMTFSAVEDEFYFKRKKEKDYIRDKVRLFLTDPFFTEGAVQELFYAKYFGDILPEEKTRKAYLRNYIVQFIDQIINKLDN
ncbi:MAG: motility associated factor glycosyltransferase family protein [Spirochaetes bacterium]|nr:motility associated factor glycosyltransferase family protein [Spirochaetota bacterium]